MLADLLADPRQLGEPAGGAVLEQAATLIEDAATEATEQGGWSGDDPLRLAKGPVAWLLRCPRRAVASAESLAATADGRHLALGRIVDAGAKLRTLTGRAEPPTVDDALAFLTASGDTNVVQHLEDIGPAAAAELRAEAVDRLGRLTATWPAFDPGWWPRVEEPIRLRLADGAVTLSGRLDLLLGGPPTDHPGLVVEVKSGRWHDTVRTDAHLYGLLVGLRDGIAPAAVLTLAAGDGASQLEPIRPAVLRHVAERVAVALQTAGALAAGEPPAAYPGSYCAHCPLRADCPEGRAAAA